MAPRGLPLEDPPARMAAASPRRVRRTIFRIRTDAAKRSRLVQAAAIDYDFVIR